MASVFRLSFALVLAGYVASPAFAGDVAGWIDREVNTALAAPENTSKIDCASTADLATAIDCEVNTALGPLRYASSSSDEPSSQPN